MNIVVKKRAYNTLTKVASYIENQNTEGSGLRWLDKVYGRITDVADSKAILAICHNESLTKFQYRCFTFNDWVIAHKVTGNKFIIYRFVHGSRLK